MSYHRIISLVPSLTELLIDLGLKDRVVGRTKFCIYPENLIHEIPSVGGTKNPKIEKILELKPDLIITNKEENRKEDVEELSKCAEIVVTEIDTIQQALEWIKKLGIQLDVEPKSDKLITSITHLLNETPEWDPINSAYFIWREPWMTIGNDTYIHNVMKRYGLINVYGNQSRYPETDFEELVSLNPKLILLSSEPYPFKQNHIQELEKVCPDSRIMLVNGEWFSWYGSRMVPAFEGLTEWRKLLSHK